MAAQSALEESLALQIRAHQLPEPQREYEFHPTRRWRFDFSWIHCRLAVEVEGAVWTRGRHTRGGGFIADCEKYNHAALLGWRVLRVTAEMIDDGRAIDWIYEALRVW